MREVTKQYGKFKITLPIGLGYKPEERRDDYASYLTEDKEFKEVNHHHIALTEVLVKYIKPTAKRILHAFGGLGATAQVIQQVAGEARHEFWERSEACCEYLTSKKWKEVTRVEDSLKHMRNVDLGKYDVVIFDPSLGTIMSPGIVEAWEYMCRYKKMPLIWVSDFATSKLHLNGRHYAKMFNGLETPTPELYATGYDNFLRKGGKSIIEAIRDSFEMYFVIVPANKKHFPKPIRKME